MADTFAKFSSTTHPIVKLEDDWNNLLDIGLHNFTGYYIKTDGTYYSAINGSTHKLIYGGPNDTGAVDGTDFDAVWTAVLAAIGDYGRVQLGSGTFYTDGLNIINSGTVVEGTRQWIEIVGEGMGNTIIQGNSTATGAASNDGGFTEKAWLMIDSFDTSGIRVHLHDFQIFGDHDTNANLVSGIILRYGRNSIIERVWVRECSTYGIYQVGPNFAYRESYIRNCIIYDINDKDGVPGAPIESACVGIKTTSADIYITNNIIGWIGWVDDVTDSLGYGIVMEDSTITNGNVIWVCATGIFTLGGSSDQLIINNLIDFAYAAGIHLYHTQRATIRNNTLRIPYQFGIYLDQATECYVHGNSLLLRDGEALLTTTNNGNVGGTTVINTNDVGITDYCKNRAIRITSGAQNGETRVISAFNSGTHTYTLEAAFGGQILAGVTYYIDYASDSFIVEGNNATNNTIRDNNCETDGTINIAAIQTTAGSTSSIKHNKGMDFTGAGGTWFDDANDRIGMIAADSATPTASTDYTVINSDIMILSTDSGGADCAIQIKSSTGGAISDAASTLSGVFVPEGYLINWGAFTGAAPTVTILFVP